MTKWRELLDSADTPGGHIVILLALLLSLFVASKLGVPKADSHIGETLAVLLYAMRGNQSNNERSTTK